MKHIIFGLIFWVLGMMLIPMYTHAGTDSGPREIELYLDTITEMRALPSVIDLPYKTWSSEELNFGNNDHVAHIRIALDTATHFLSIENAHLDYVHAHFFDDQKHVLRSYMTGDALAFDTRPLHTNFFVFPIPRKARIVTISAQTQGILVIPLRFFTLSEYVKQENTQRVVLWIFIGISISVFFSAGIIGLFLRNYDYILYALFAFFFMVYIVLDFGVLFQFVWPQTPQCNKFVPILYALYMLVLMIFQYVFFRIHHSANRWLKYTFYMLKFWSICAIGITFFDYYIALVLLKWVLPTGILLLVFNSAHATYKRPEKSFVVFSAGWLVFLIAGVYYSMAIYKIVPYSAQVGNVLIMANGLQILLFYLAVGFRVDDLRKRAQKAQEKVILMLQENEKSLERNNELLEQKVAERTQELYQINEEYKQQNELLSISQNELIKKQQILEDKNKEIDTLNRKLKDYNKELERAVHKQTHELKASNNLLKDKNMRLEQFSQVASHNLRSPVAAILGICDLLSNYSLHEEEKIQYIAQLKIIAKKLDDVVHGLAYISESTAHSSHLKVQVSIDELCSEVLDLLKTDIDKSQANILQYTQLCTHVYAIPIYLHNILYNLIHNAIKYAKPNVAPVVEIETRLEGAYYAIVIKDNGEGIDLNKVHSKIFMPFERFNSVKPGSGLGLYLVKTQTEAMNGHIEVHSKPGEGSTFIVYLPVSAPTNDST